MKNIKLVLFIGLIFINLKIENTRSWFTDVGQAGGVFAAASDWHAPISTLKNLFQFQTHASWDLNFTATDSNSGLDFVKLYYRKGDSGSFSLYDTRDFNGEKNASGNFTFTALQGDGEYQFYVIAGDISKNIESIPPAPYVSTILDRVAPVTILTTTHGIVVDEKVTNGDFESGLGTGWNHIGSVSRITSDNGITPPSASGHMVRVGDPENYDGEIPSGNSIWDNKLTQIISKTNGYLSFYYRVLSFDYSENPAAMVMANDSEVLRISSNELAGGYPFDSGWHRVFIDLSNFSDSKIELKFYAGNTDSFAASQSWMYLDEVTTGKPALNSNLSNLILTAADTNGISEIKYSFDNGAHWVTGAGNNIVIDGSSLVADLENRLLFYSVDLAGNSESIPSHPQEIIVDNQAPSPPTGFIATGISEHELLLAWTAPADHGYFTRAAFYFITLNGQKVPTAPAPAAAGQSETFLISGLSPGVDYSATISACDPVGNCSLPVTANQPTIPETDNDPGDVVINELMWMGTSVNSGDEWIELRNMTNRNINLQNWRLTKKSADTDVTMYTFGTTDIPAHSYLLIAEFDKDHSALNINPDIVIGAGDGDSTGFALIDTNLQIKLFDATNLLIDTADDGNGIPAAGLNSLNGETVYYSMERNAIPANGIDASSWHTAFADSLIYFDAGFTNIKGTPKAENQSQTPLHLNEPDLKLSTSSLNLEISSGGPSPIITPEPTIVPTLQIFPSPLAPVPSLTQTPAVIPSEVMPSEIIPTEIVSPTPVLPLPGLTLTISTPMF